MDDLSQNHRAFPLFQTLFSGKREAFQRKDTEKLMAPNIKNQKVKYQLKRAQNDDPKKVWDQQ